jgi:hypothetical protein
LVRRPKYKKSIDGMSPAELKRRWYQIGGYINKNFNSLEHSRISHSEYENNRKWAIEQSDKVNDRYRSLLSQRRKK